WKRPRSAMCWCRRLAWDCWALWRTRAKWFGTRSKFGPTSQSIRKAGTSLTIVSYAICRSGRRSDFPAGPTWHRATGGNPCTVPIARRGYNWLTSGLRLFEGDFVLRAMESFMAAATTSSKGLKGPISAGKEKHPVTVPDFLAAKARGVRLTMLTAYDYTMAR